jgi:hypothetical protein
MRHRAAEGDGESAPRVIAQAANGWYAGRSFVRRPLIGPAKALDMTVSVFGT